MDAAGQADRVAHLALVHPQGSCMDIAGTGWQAPEESRDGWWDGLPYPLIDMRPQGYLGRQLARAEHCAFGVSVNPEAWSDDDVAHVLSRIGSDTSGNLILGNAALERWQTNKLSPPESMAAIKPRAAGRAYARMAELAIAAGVLGSSAAGEFPKFTALCESAGSATPHVLVKFSGADGSPAVQRWSDLLVCEHLALECAATLPGAASTYNQHAQPARTARSLCRTVAGFWKSSAWTATAPSDAARCSAWAHWMRPCWATARPTGRSSRPGCTQRACWALTTCSASTNFGGLVASLPTATGTPPTSVSRRKQARAC